MVTFNSAGTGTPSFVPGSKDHLLVAVLACRASSKARGQPTPGKLAPLYSTFNGAITLPIIFVAMLRTIKRTV
jgi:hypothetical protein